MPTKLCLPRFSGTALKRIACLCMLLDHIGAVCLYQGVLAVWPGIEAGTRALRASDPAFAAWYWAYYILRTIGRLAFPLYCFLLAEGFRHTKNVARYAGRLLLFAFCSEIPFDLAFRGRLFSTAGQNVYFTLFFGLCALWLIKQLDGTHWYNPFFQMGALCVFVLLAQKLSTDYGAKGVLLIVVFHAFRSLPFWQLLCGYLLTRHQRTAPLAILLSLLYSGQRGRCARWEQLAFYVFYPAHLLLLYGFTRFILL